METIEEYNKRSEKMGVTVFNFTIISEWKLSGIMCPCGCQKELLTLHPQPPGLNLCFYEHIKCQETGKEGTIKKDGTVMGIIEGIEWDEQKKEKG